MTKLVYPELQEYPPCPLASTESLSSSFPRGHLPTRSQPYGENPKAARTLLCGRGSRLIPRSPASETNCRSPAVFRAAAEAAKKKRSSGQYATTEIGHAASELQKGQRAIWGPCVEIRGHQRAQEVEQLAAAGVVRAAKAAEVGRGSAKLQRQDAANVVWAARAAEVGRTGSRGAQSPDCRRLAKPECRGKKKPPEGDVKSSRSSMSLQTLVAKKGQLSESLSSGSC
ncbi:hypothetical protein IWW34DRAFT_838596 [Fusarium oxysporum f. sp. albedinis]|nr:hypothetical protein IWW34DRAFT_838596 [Fusarium oxysporum f. sp. albedinis]